VPPQSPAAEAAARPATGWVPTKPPDTNLLAVLSLIIGFLAVLGLPGRWAAEEVFFGGLTFVFGIAAFVLGVVAIGQIREQGQAGHGMAVTGVVLGTVAFALGFMQALGSNAFAW